MSKMPSFTKTEAKILEMLRDGLAHKREELFTCLPDDMGDLGNLAYHICQMRKKLQVVGQTIVCEYVPRFSYRYRHVRLLTSPCPCHEPKQAGSVLAS